MGRGAVTTGMELVVAWYFAVMIGKSPVSSIDVVGPFSTDSQCERVRQWASRTGGLIVSECYYGPAVSITRGEKK